MLRSCTLLALLLIFPAAHARDYMGQRVLDIPFAIAGGKVLSLPATDAGPIPAEDRKARIELAGFSIMPSQEDAKQPVLVWGFGFTNKGMKDIVSVDVMEVAPASTEIVLIHDAAPSLSDASWQATTSPVVVTKDAMPWLYADGPSIYVFKFTISERGKTPRVLYQPAWFSPEVKAKFRQMITSITGS